VGGHQRESRASGSSLREKLNQAGLTDLAPGVIARVVDRRLSFPHNLLRRIHQSRFALILSNDRLCASKDIPLIVIAPMTHRLDIRSMTDVEVKKNAENGLETDSLVQLQLIQPLMKTDIVGKVGMLGARDWDGVLRRLVWMTDRA
jgi:mRNA interferase MazF